MYSVARLFSSQNFRLVHTWEQYALPHSAALATLGGGIGGLSALGGSMSSLGGLGLGGGGANGGGVRDLMGGAGGGAGAGGGGPQTVFQRMLHEVSTY